MIKHESAFDLFQRLNIKDDNKYSLIIDRLNRYFNLFFPNGFHSQGQLIELLDTDRTTTNTFLHGFIFDYIEHLNHRNEILNLPLKSEEILSNSPRANKDSVGSGIPILQSKLNSDESITFLYIDTEYKECPFHNDILQWYDCETSTELIGTLIRFEQSYFILNPNQRFILIINSSTQVSVNDYFHLTTPTDVLSIEENKQFTIQWHTILYRMIIKYKLLCILVEHLHIDTPMFDFIVTKRDDRTMKRNSRNKDQQQIPFSEFAFGRLMISEHYNKEWNNQFEYRQIRVQDIIHFSSSTSLFNNENSL